MGAGKMSQWLGTLVVLTEDMSLISSTNVEPTNHSSSSRESNPLFCSSWSPATYLMHVHSGEIHIKLNLKS